MIDLPASDHRWCTNAYVSPIVIVPTRGSPFHVFQFEGDPIEYQQELQRYPKIRAHEQAKADLLRQGKQQLELSERLELGDQLPMGNCLPSPLSTPSGLGTPTLSMAGVGRGGPMGSKSPM